jgi:acylphosphatase
MLKLTGWVRNLPDGRVEAVFEGNEKDIDKIIQFCKIGPRGAVVKDITVEEEPFQNEFNDFRIKY